MYFGNTKNKAGPHAAEYDITLRGAKSKPDAKDTTVFAYYEDDVAIIKSRTTQK